MLNELQIHWDNKVVNYDLEKYNWPAWALSVIQEVAPQIKELETLHNFLTPAEIVRVSQHVQNACSRRDFMERFDEFAESIVPQRIGNKRYMIQRQGTLRVVIPNQAKVGRRLAFHQGIFVGNGRGCRTIWTPFTRAEKTNTMWMLDLAVSREITKKILAEKWSMEKFEEESLKHAWPVTLDPGQSHLFFQEHIHGNVNNDEGYTRVSMDMRILIEGEEWGRRLPGGFMRLPGDYEVTETMDYTGKSFITYAGWNSKFSNAIPLPMQRHIIDPYCAKHGIKINDYQFENEFLDWFPGLEKYITGYNVNGIVMCSIYCLPDNPFLRHKILKLAVDNNVELHFANELCSVRTLEDIKHIQQIFEFAEGNVNPNDLLGLTHNNTFNYGWY